MDIQNLIGTRLDKITLQGGKIMKIEDLERLKAQNIVTDIPPTESEKVKGIDKRYMTSHGERFSHLKIKKDGEIDVLKAGSAGYGRNYVTLQTSVRNEMCGNLVGNTLTEYQEQIRRIEKHLAEKYCIHTSFQDADLKYLEINRTFPIANRFDDYGRVIKLILDEMPRMNTISTHGRTLSDNRFFPEKAENIGTYTVWNRRKTSGKSKQCKIVTIYNKRQQISGIIYLDQELMRFEIRLVGKRTIQNALGTSKLSELTDQIINDYFAAQIDQLIMRPLEKWRANRNQYILRLMQQERTKDRQNWQVNILRALTVKENLQNGKPCVLDVSELDALVDRTDLKRKSRIKANFRKQAQKYETIFCNGDDLKLQEIIDNLLADELPQVATVDNPGHDLVAGVKSS